MTKLILTISNILLALTFLGAVYKTPQSLEEESVMLLLRSVVIIAFMLLTIIEGGFNERLRDTFTLTSPL